MTDSKFDQFDGYYSARFSGIEFARFAPSPVWSDYANSMKGVDDFSYAFIATDSGVTSDHVIDGMTVPPGGPDDDFWRGAQWAYGQVRDVLERGSR